VLSYLQCEGCVARYDGWCAGFVNDVDRGLVEDVQLERKQSWDGNSLVNLVAELMEENLRNSARSLLRP